MKTRRLRWELVGAAVGAGMASGREAASFFGRYGMWGFAGVLLAAGVMALLAPAELPRRWQGRWPHRLWQALQALLLTATGGAMLSAAGETAAMALPLAGAYPAAAALTLLLAWVLARRTENGLAVVSRSLLAVLAALTLAGLLVPPMRGVLLEPPAPTAVFLRSAAYGGFNAALLSPVLAASAASQGEKGRENCRACLMIALFLLAAQALLLRHPALLAEPLPFVRMTAQLGRGGFLLACGSLYLATLSTLTACITGLRGSVLGLAGVVLCACAGFTGAVDILYPVLGAGCFLLMAAAKFTNCWRKTFHSRRDML